MDAVEAVEKILDYSFVNKTLLKEALPQTFSKGCGESCRQYKRLEFLGDAVLAFAFTIYIHHTYPNLKLKELRKLRSANVSNEKFARVTVKHNLCQFAIRKHPSTKCEKIKEFSEAVTKEGDPVPYGGLVRAPKFYADLVESIAGAVYSDVNYDVQRFWEIFRGLLEPIYTPDDLRLQPKPPFLKLFRLADKHGKRVDFRYSKDDESSKNIAEVYLDDIFIASGCAKRIDTAKLLATEEALQKLSDCMPVGKIIDEDNLDVQIENVKRKLIEICSIEKLHIQTGSFSCPTASEIPLTDVMTQEQMVIDEDIIDMELEDVKRKLIEICSTEKLRLQTGSSSFPTASENPLTEDMPEEQIVIDEDSPHVEPEDAKGKLFKICAKNKWPRPIFSVEEERGPKNEQKFVCSVKIEIPTIEGSFHMKGDVKSKKKQAENSSAYHMIRALESSIIILVISNLQMPKSLDEKKKNLQMQENLDENKNLHSKKRRATYEMTPNKMVIGEDSLDVETEDVKGNLREICSTEKLQLQTRSSSLPTASEKPLTDELTQEQIIVDENSPHVEPEYLKGKLFEICSTRKLQTQTGSSSLPTASENPSTYEMTTRQMIVDKDSLHVETEDVKGKLFEICAKNKWPNPTFSVEEERDPKNEQKIVCSVKIEIPTIEGTFHIKGDAKSKIKQAENSSNGLNYIFTNKNLLNEALSQTSSLVKRLMLVGEAALELAFMNHIYLMYPKLEASEMNVLRIAHTRNKNYARVAVKHNISQISIRKVKLDEKIKVFSEVGGKEYDPVPWYSQSARPPKVVADLVDSVAGAVFIDMNFDVKRLWEIFRGLFEPLYTLDDEHGKRFDFRYKKYDERTITAHVYIDDKFIARGRNKRTRDAAKMSAAMEALQKLSKRMPVEIVMDEDRLDIEMEDAKDKLIEICHKEKVAEPGLQNKAKSGGFVCSPKIEIPTEEGTLYVKGDRRKLRKTAENSSASHVKSLGIFSKGRCVMLDMYF